ncbi:MAG: calcium-binding protein [Planctomycetota bacterium]|jgi:hypothetical protein
MREKTIAAISVLVLAGVLISCSVARADRTIRATSGNDVIYFGVVDDAGARRLCVVTKTGSGTISVGNFNMDTGRLTIYGQGGDDHIEAISNDIKEDIAFINISELRFTEVYLYGGPGNDELWGTPIGDNLYGNEGNDLLVGKSGVDVLNGDDGDDYLWAYPGDDVLDGGSGDDFLLGDQGNDTLLGGPGNDTLVGNPRLLLADRAAGAVLLLSNGGDRPLAGDFDRDGRCDDVAVFRPTTRSWYYDYNHDGNTDDTFHWAVAGDIPVAGDFDSDGRIDDVAVFRPGNRTWYYDYNHNGTTDDTSGPWGNPGDIPIAGNFDADRRCDDVGVFRPGNRTWYYDYDHNGTTDEQHGPWGLAGDIPIVGDFFYTGQNDDVAVFRPSARKWYYDYMHDGTTDFESNSAWARLGDIPVAGDFDSDNRYDDVGVFRMSNRTWYYDYNHTADTDDSVGPWAVAGEPLHTTHKQYGDSCGPANLSMVFEHLGMTDHSLRRWFRRDLDHTSSNPVPSPWWPENAVDVGYELSMEHIMWEWYHEKRQREPGWNEGGSFMTADGRLNTDDATQGWLPNDHQGWFYEITYDMGNINWDAATKQATGPVQKWLKHSHAVGWRDNEQQVGLAYVANKFSGGINDAKPIALTVGAGGNFKSFSHLKAVIEGFINHGIPLVVAVENGGHFNTLIGYWNVGSTFYIYTAEPLDGWGRPFYNKPMRWRRIVLNANMLATGTGTLVGIMPYGHATQVGVGADWARQIDNKYNSDVLCGYLR